MAYRLILEPRMKWGLISTVMRGHDDGACLAVALSEEGCKESGRVVPDVM